MTSLQRDLLQEGAGRGGEGRGRDKSLPFLEFKFTAYTHIIAKPSISLALVQELIQYECTPKSGDPFEYSIVMKFHKFLTLILPRSNMKLCQKWNLILKILIVHFIIDEISLFISNTRRRNWNFVKFHRWNFRSIVESTRSLRFRFYMHDHYMYGPFHVTKCTNWNALAIQ